MFLNTAAIGICVLLGFDNLVVIFTWRRYVYNSRHIILTWWNQLFKVGWHRICEYRCIVKRNLEKRYLFLGEPRHRFEDNIQKNFWRKFKSFVAKLIPLVQEQLRVVVKNIMNLYFAYNSGNFLVSSRPVSSSWWILLQIFGCNSSAVLHIVCVPRLVTSLNP